MKSPVAKKIRTTFENHGDIRHDDYYWLNEKTNRDVIAHLEAENAYFANALQPLQHVQQELFDEMVARIPAEEIHVPIQQGPYYYYMRQQKDLQYPIYARRKATTREAFAAAQEEITLNVNDMVSGDDYLSVTHTCVSDDHRYFAYLENRDGSDAYTAYIKDLQTNTLLQDTIPNVYIYASLEWSSCGQYIFYVTINEQQRPYKLWRHKVGTAVSDDVMLYEEMDDTFSLYIHKSQSGAYIFATSTSTTTTEVRYMRADEPLHDFQLFAARRKNVEYDVEHWQHDFIILTNEDALNFKLMHCATDDVHNVKPLVRYDESFFLTGMYPFADKLYITGRANGLEQVFYVHDGALQAIRWDEPIYATSLVDGQDYNASEVLVTYQSFVTPRTTYSIQPETGEKTMLQQAEVSGTYDASQYEQQLLWATAPDGVQVPVHVHYRKQTRENGAAPLILDAYGSYGSSSDPFFSAYRIPLLDRGVIFAVAQVRGGSELGRSWYFDGKMQHKMNTFTDYIAAADTLVAGNWTTNEQLIGRGGSAGGLLIGAVANLAGEKFKVLVPEVPFVDVLTTMLDDTIPLTTSEYDEWGNPNIEADYRVMRMYSPYENVEQKAYPHMFVTAGLNDPRVGYFEPAKWVARLRELKTDDNTIVLKTNMGAGHFGASGRMNQLKELAEFYAFVLTKVNAL